jgi:glycosyltransferase involved in cell wall biosynthesis
MAVEGGFSVSIVICTLNRASHLQDALASLRNLEHPNFEVIVVNGPSSDKTMELLEKWQSDVKVVHCSERNLSMSRNVGLSVSAGDLTAFIDDDAVAHPRWLKNLINWFYDERVAAVGGYTIDNTGVKFQARKTLCDRFGNAFFVSDLFDERSLCFPDTPIYPSLLGTNAVFRTSVLRDIGGFDQVFAYYLDETDVCLRIIDQGYRILYEPTALVFHQFAPSHIRDVSRVPRTLYPSAVSKSYFIIRHGARFGLENASDEIKRYETEITESNKWLAEHNEISVDHRFSLDQDLLWGVAQGVRLAQTQAEPGPELLLPEVSTAFKRFGTAEHKFRICMVSQNYPPQVDAGIGRWTSTVANGLASRGHRVHIITRAPAAAESVRYHDNIWIHSCCPNDEAAEAFAERYRLPVNLAAWCARVYREVQTIKTFGIDVVSFPIWDLEGIACLDDQELVTCVSLHTTYALALPFKPDWIERPLFKGLHVDKVIAAERECLARAPILLGNSEAIVRDIEAAYDLVLDGRCTIIPHGTHDFLPESAAPTRAAGQRLTVLFVGRFEKRKGFDIALEAADRVLRTHTSIRFEFVGDELNAATIGLINDLGFAGLLKETRIQFSGIVEREALETSYQNCDIVLMPSRYESFGLVAIEAMAAAKPVIALNNGGLREIVVDGISGALIAPDAEAGKLIAEVIGNLARDEATRSRLAHGARQRFEECFTVDSMTANLETVFHHAISTGKSL